MNPSAALNELQELAKKLDVEIVFDHFTGDGARTGGVCKVKGKWRVIIERRVSDGEKVSVLARALCRFDNEAHFVSPGVRALLDAQSTQVAITDSAAS